MLSCCLPSGKVDSRSGGRLNRSGFQALGFFFSNNEHWHITQMFDDFGRDVCFVYIYKYIYMYLECIYIYI